MRGDGVSCLARTVRVWPLFIAACAGGGPANPQAATPVPAPVVPDAGVRPPPVDAAVAARGDACSDALPCAPGLACVTGLTAFGGYCASACDATCDGACVGTATGELCMAACTRDDECRTGEGYVCDPQWRACVMPNATAIVPRDCPAPRGIGRDLAFAPPTPLAAATESAAVVMADGAVVVVHADAKRVLAVTRIDARAQPVVIAQLGTGSGPALARDGRTLYAVWQAEGVMLATSRDGTTWTRPRAVDACTSCRAAVVTGGGAAHVVIAGDAVRVRTSRDGGKSFAPARTIAPGIAASAAVAADGRLHAVALEGGPLGGYGSAHTRALYVPPGGQPIVVSRRDEQLPFHFAIPRIAIDSRRRWIYVAYVRGGRDGVWDLQLAASRDGGKTWLRARIGDDPPCAIHMVPNLAIDPRTGRVHVTWYDSRGARFAHATCGPGLARCSQLGRLDDAPLGALSTVRGRLGDATSLLVDDARRTLHAVWTQPGGTPRVVHAKAKLPLR